MEQKLQSGNEPSTIYITTEKVIVNLLKADKKKYLTISRLYRFAAYLRHQLEKEADLSPYAKVVFDINFDAIERTVQFNDMIYDLVDDKIFLKGVLPTIDDDFYLLTKAAQEFADMFAA